MTETDKHIRALSIAAIAALREVEGLRVELADMSSAWTDRGREIARLNAELAQVKASRDAHLKQREGDLREQLNKANNLITDYEELFMLECCLGADYGDGCTLSHARKTAETISTLREQLVAANIELDSRRASQSGWAHDQLNAECARHRETRARLTEVEKLLSGHIVDNDTQHTRLTALETAAREYLAAEHNERETCAKLLPCSETYTAQGQARQARATLERALKETT